MSNYTLKYRTFNQLLEDVTIDFNTFALENMIEPQQLIKLVKKINYDLGLKVNQTKEVILEISHGKVKLPDDFYVLNNAMICGKYTENVGYDGLASGTTMQEIPYTPFPDDVEPCSTPVENECVTPNITVNCHGESYQLTQIIKTGAVRTYKHLMPLKMKASKDVYCKSPTLSYNAENHGWLQSNYLYVTFQTGNVYIEYQGAMEDEEGNLLVPDHDLLNEYYEYALKHRILENLYMNGEDVSQRLGLIEQRLRTSRTNALSLVNTPDFKDLEKMWWTNRKAQYNKYYNMFKSNT